MQAMDELIQFEDASISKLAARLASIPRKGEMDGTKHCVCLSETVSGLLSSAKPEKQSMPEFLREAALTVALQRLEASQS